MRWMWIAVACLGLAGCGGLPMGMDAASAPMSPAPDSGPLLTADDTARAFGDVVARIEPMAENFCLQRTRNVPCDFQIVVDARPGQQANAYQTLDPQGRPVVALTLALLDDARNADELAFVLGHETSHHILGHIPRQQETAMTGAMLAGVLAQMGGADVETIRSVQQMGASVGARTFSKDFELEADTLGTEITLLAGYDPVRGAAFFARLPDPGEAFLGSHPPNAQRIAIVQRRAAELGY